MEPTDLGVPQGGVVSPCQHGVRRYGSTHPRRGSSAGCILVRNADDFIVIGPEEATLKKARVLIEQFLMERGLELNQEKTKLTTIEQGFEFLGFHFK